MDINNKYKLKDAYPDAKSDRYSLRGAYVTEDGKRLVATEGKIMVSVPLAREAEPALRGKMIPAEALEDAQSRQKGLLKSVGAYRVEGEEREKGEGKETVFSFQADNGSKTEYAENAIPPRNFPTGWETVLEADKTRELLKSPLLRAKENAILLTIDTKLLKKLVAGLGGDSVVSLIIRHDGRGNAAARAIGAVCGGISSRAELDDAAIGAIMPCKNGIWEEEEEEEEEKETQ